MGLQAVRSHSKSAAHMKAINATTAQPSVASLFSFPGTSAGSSVAVEPSSDVTIIEEPCSLVQQAPPVPLVVKDATVRAEVVWAMKSVMSRFSFRSADQIADVFRCMFPDSEICRNFSMGRDKIGYILTYGIAPYFKRQLQAKISDCDEISVSFDEALNRIAQKGQMDIIVRFWDVSVNRVSTRYFNSAFLGKACATDLLHGFKEGLDPIPLPKIIQVSMDGPSVNHKFYRDLKNDLEISHDAPQLVDCGTCSLHVLNGAFQAGHKLAGWKLNDFFRSLYYIFKDCPSRRAEYHSVTGSELWPLKFCAVRWTENSKVADRLQMLPFLRKWFERVKQPSESNVGQTLREFLRNPAIEAKLEFFKSVSLVVEPFLKEFQTAAPLFPLLYQKLEDLIRNLLARIVNPEIMREATSAAKLTNIDLSDNSAALLARVEIGFGARKYLDGDKLTPTQKLAFYSDCGRFYKKMAQKIIERCPLRYKFVRAASSISPVVMQNAPSIAEKRFEILLQLLVQNNRLSVATADSAKSQYTLLIGTQSFSDALKSHDSNTLLDEFFASQVASSEDFQALWRVIKLVLVFFHGNASVESGFSVNEDMLVENLASESLVGLRLAYDGIKAAGGPLNVQLTPDMMKMVRTARGRYRERLESRRFVATTEQSVRETAKRQAHDKLEELQVKRRQLLADAKSQEKAMLREMADVQKLLS